MLWNSKQDVSKNNYFWKGPFGPVRYTVTGANFRSDERQVILNRTWDIVKTQISPDGNMVFCVCVWFLFLKSLIELKKKKRLYQIRQNKKKNHCRKMWKQQSTNTMLNFQRKKSERNRPAAEWKIWTWCNREHPMSTNVWLCKKQVEKRFVGTLQLDFRDY